MWQWIPPNVSPGASTTRRTAASASPFATENPNLDRSVPVSMYSWVCASTPGVTRTNTDAAEADPLESVQLGEGVRDDDAHAGVASRFDLLVALVVPVEHQSLTRESRPGARRAARRPSPHRASARLRRPAEPSPGTGTPCPRTRRSPAPKLAANVRAPGPEVVLVVHEQRRPELRRERTDVHVEQPGRHERLVERCAGTCGHACSLGASPAPSSSGIRSITSGALTPRIPSASASPMRHASVSQSRA